MRFRPRECSVEGFRRSLSRLKMFLSETVNCHPDIIDTEQLERAMTTYSQGLGNAVVGNHIAASLSLLVWLRQMIDQPPRVATPAHRIPLPADPSELPGGRPGRRGNG